MCITFGLMSQPMQAPHDLPLPWLPIYKWCESDDVGQFNKFWVKGQMVVLTPTRSLLTPPRRQDQRWTPCAGTLGRAAYRDIYMYLPMLYQKFFNDEQKSRQKEA